VGAWLTELFLNECNVGPVGARALAAALPRCAALDKLGLNYNRLGDDGAVALLRAVTASGRLRSGSSGSSGFCPSGAGRCSGVRTLGLIGNGLSDRTAFAAAACLRGRLEGGGGGDGGDLGSQPAATFVASTVGTSGASEAEEAAREAEATDDDDLPLCSLRRLYLNENELGDAGATALASALQVSATRARRRASTRPATPAVHACNDADKAAAAAAAAVLGADEAERGGKVVPGDGADASVAVPTSSWASLCLERLGLSDNAIGAAGGQALLGALTYGQAPLGKLCCSDNPWGAPTQRALASLPNVFAGAKVKRTLAIARSNNRHLNDAWLATTEFGCLDALHPAITSHSFQTLSRLSFTSLSLSLMLF
jgi:hypothetical protein